MPTIAHTLDSSSYVQITTGATSVSIFHLSGDAVKYVQAEDVPEVDSPCMAISRVNKGQEFSGLVDENTVQYIYAIATTENGATISVTEKII